MKKAENRETKKGYPILPYLIGLFITVIALVVLSYLMQMRNKQELLYNANQNYINYIACSEYFEFDV